MPKQNDDCSCSESQTENQASVEHTKAMTSDALALLQHAAVPREFMETVQTMIPDKVTLSPVEMEMMPAHRGRLNATSIEMLPPQHLVTPEEMSIAPDLMLSPDSSIKKMGTETFNLTDLRLDTRGVTQMTLGLGELSTTSLSWLVNNTFYAEQINIPFFMMRTEGVQVCVRIFVIDLCGRKKSDPAPGILKGVTYPAYAKAPHLGRLDKSVIEQVVKTIEDANKIWAQCQTTTIRFTVATNKDDSNQPFIYALDAAQLSDVMQDDRLTVEFPTAGTSQRIPIIETRTIDLCALFDKDDKGQPTRNLTTVDGDKNTTITYKFTWKNTVPNNDVPIAQGGAVPATILTTNKRVASKSGAFDALTMFGQPIDLLHGEECINVFVVGNFEDTGEKHAGEESGWGAEPGRIIILDENVISGQKGRVLAHEFGHNLGLPHDEEGNLMHPSKGITLREGGENDQCGRAAKRAAAIPGSKRISNAR